jgi:hypothetical protein
MAVWPSVTRSRSYRSGRRDILSSGWKFWERWYFWATHSRLESIRKAAEMVRRHIDNILTYYQHPVTNAMSEGLNSKIQKIKRMACGFRNLDNFKTAIYFHCGDSIFTHAKPGSASLFKRRHLPPGEFQVLEIGRHQLWPSHHEGGG